MPRGRPKGALNKKTRQALYAAQRGELPGVKGMTPLEFLMKTMKDDEKPFEIRLEAAKSAAPYIHPRLSSAEVKQVGESLSDALARLSRLEAKQKQEDTPPQKPEVEDRQALH